MFPTHHGIADFGPCSSVSDSWTTVPFKPWVTDIPADTCRMRQKRRVFHTCSFDDTSYATATKTTNAGERSEKSFNGSLSGQFLLIVAGRNQIMVSGTLKLLNHFRAGETLVTSNVD